MPLILSCNPSGKWGFKVVITHTLTKPTTGLQSSAATDGDQKSKTITEKDVFSISLLELMRAASCTFSMGNLKPDTLFTVTHV